MEDCMRNADVWEVMICVAQREHCLWSCLFLIISVVKIISSHSLSVLTALQIV